MKLAIQITISTPIANRDDVDKLLERWIQMSLKKVRSVGLESELYSLNTSFKDGVKEPAILHVHINQDTT